MNFDFELSRVDLTSVISLFQIGLDPAAPAFTKNNPAIRISPTDAAFVDVLHTDGGGNFQSVNP